MSRSREDAVIGGGSLPASSGCLPGKYTYGSQPPGSAAAAWAPSASPAAVGRRWRRGQCWRQSNVKWRGEEPGKGWAHPLAGSSSSASSTSGMKPGRADLWLCSNIWFWRCTTGILAVVVVLILCIHLAVNKSSGKGSYGSPPWEVCPANWLYHQRKCYYFSETEKDWDSSRSFCSSHNSSLTVIENQQELNFIMKITKQDPWIGLHKAGEEFHWVNGTPLERNLLAVKGSGECAYIESDVVSSSGCSLTRGWVCKKTS